MKTPRWRLRLGRLFTIFFAGMLLAVPATRAEDQDKLDLDKIPQKVMEALKAKFPKAEIHKWTKEMEGDVVVYDFEFKQEGRNFEADIKENGAIHNWEKAIEAKALPKDVRKAVRKAVRKKYPKSTFKEIMEITAVKDGKDALEGYEIVLVTADKKEAEVTVAPDGKILEDSGAKKETKEKDNLNLDKIPQKVMGTLKAKFPKAEIRKWTKEMEGDVAVYDIEFKQEGRNFEADIKEDGTIHNWEKAIEAKALPQAVTKAVESKYPKSTLKAIMEITAVRDGKDALEGYEIVLDTADKKEVEVAVAPDGKILEDSGETK